MCSVNQQLSLNNCDNLTTLNIEFLALLLFSALHLFIVVGVFLRFLSLIRLLSDLQFVNCNYDSDKLIGFSPEGSELFFQYISNNILADCC